MTLKITENLPVNWQDITAETLAGTRGHATVRTQQFDNFKIRKLEFSANYEADHWCSKGHIIQVVTGELIILNQDQSQFVVAAADTVVLGDDVVAHKALTKIETSVLIIDF